MEHCWSQQRDASRDARQLRDGQSDRGPDGSPRPPGLWGWTPQHSGSPASGCKGIALIKPLVSPQLTPCNETPCWASCQGAMGEAVREPLLLSARSSAWHTHPHHEDEAGTRPPHTSTHVTPSGQQGRLTSCRPPDILWWSVWLHLVENSSFFHDLECP